MKALFHLRASTIFTARILGSTLHIRRGTALVLNAGPPATTGAEKNHVSVIDCTEVTLCQSVQFSKQFTKKQPGHQQKQ